jgi:hypothetical protein
MTNADLVEDEKKNVPKNPEDARTDLASGNLSMEKNFAYIAQLLKDDILKKTDKVGNQTVAEFVKTHGEEFKTYGQGKTKADYNQKFGENDNTRAADEEIKKNGADAKVTVLSNVKDEFGHVVHAAGDLVKASDLLNASFREMAQSASKVVAGKMDVNGMSQEELKRLIGAFAVYAPGNIAPLLKKARSPAIMKIEAIYKSAIDDKKVGAPVELEEEKKAIEKNTKLSREQKDESIAQINALMAAIPTLVDGKLLSNGKRAGGAKKIVEKSLLANVLFSGYDKFENESGGGPAPKAAPGGGSTT